MARAGTAIGLCSCPYPAGSQKARGKTAQPICGEHDDLWAKILSGCYRRGTFLPECEQAVQCRAWAAREDRHVSGDDRDAGANPTICECIRIA
jgi:hypothetical protein